jgi:iron complex outermembrane recepter protein
MRTRLCPTHVMVVSGLLISSMTSPSLRAQQPDAAAPQPADSAATGLEEIVVTATRKAESLSHVPLSVTALTQQNMDDANVRTLSDIQSMTPGLQFSPQAGPSGTSSISIRGVSSAVGASTTGIYIDDTPIQVRATGNGSSNAYPEVFDLERVEVLRGPQGTLFGAGSEGGAVRFITPQASLSTYSASVRSELSFTDNGGSNYEFGAAAGGPIIQDQLGFRASAWYRQDGGYIDQVNPDSNQLVAKNSNSKQSAAVKLGLTWSPLAGLTLTPSVYYQDVNSANRNDFWLSLSDPGQGEYRNGYAIPEPNEDTFVLPALRAQYDFSGMSLVSNTSFFYRSDTATYDYVNYVDDIISGVPAPAIPNQVDNAYILNRQNTLTQEVRLQSANPDDRLNWVAGFFYSNSRQLNRQYNYDPNFNAALMSLTAGAPICPANGCNSQQLLGLPLLNGNSLFLASDYSSDEQVAGFGQIDFRIVGGLKLTAGVRYSHLDYKFNTSGAGPFYGPASSTSGEHTESPVTPKYGLSYQFDSALVYASASKGLRPGGSQTPAAANVCGPDLKALGLASNPTQYDSDSLWSYELGTKLQFLDNSVHVDASVFKINWNNIQQAVPLPACGGGFIDNLGTATSTGFDLSTQYKPDSHFLFGASVGYTDAKFTRTFALANGEVLVHDGDPVADAGAPWTANVNAEYDQRLFSGYDGFIRLDERYQSRWRTPDPTVYGYDPGLPPLPEQKQLNAKAGVRLDSFEISLFANNVTNAHSLLALTHDAIGSPLYYGIAQTPRTIGIVGNYHY